LTRNGGGGTWSIDSDAFSLKLRLSSSTSPKWADFVRLILNLPVVLIWSTDYRYECVSKCSELGWDNIPNG
jgi:hypothetical protein